MRWWNGLLPAAAAGQAPPPPPPSPPAAGPLALLEGPDFEHYTMAMAEGALRHYPVLVEASGLQPGGAALTLEGYTKWVATCPAVHDILCSLLKGVGRPAMKQQKQQVSYRMQYRSIKGR